jgi:hypothetical protein
MRLRIVSLLLFAGGPLVAQAAPIPPTYPGSQPPDAWFGIPDGRGVTVFYEWARDWPQPRDEPLGNTHGCMVVDARGNVLVNTDTEAAVMVFAPSGELVTTWGKEFGGGLHGMCLVEEGDTQVLYLAHTRRHEVVKTTIDGTVLWTLGWPEASGVYEREQQFVPTAVAVGPDGRIFVADGYGKSWVHVFDRERRYVKSFGGPGSEPGQMQTPHGLWLDARGEEPLLLVCDRENHRLQWFTLDGGFVRLMDRDLRRPCNVWPLGDGRLVVADLGGRITILGADDRLVLHLGDNPDAKLRASNGVPREQWRDGLFLAPHSVCVDGQGHIYVMDWNASGRISKLTRTAAFVTDLFAGDDEKE